MTPRPHRWYAIPVRVLLVAFIGTLISFAVSLLLGILGIIAISALHHIDPNMTLAYRRIALPGAAIGGSTIFVLALAMEIRHYRQSKTLAAIERMS
jgi:ABC-type cobalamin transport system permease subunit